MRYLEFDYTTGRELNVASYPSPTELRERYRADNKPVDDTTAERLLRAGNRRRTRRPAPLHS